MPVKIPAGLFTNGMTFAFYDCKNKVVLTENTSIQELINQKQFSLKMSKKRTFTITSLSCITRNFTFVDYLKAGVQIGLSIAIDFTG